ncbi:MAG: DUF4407 domain-containing protein [Candidatus Bathyarchaeota archaeon]|nr:DUF4407 domain-containing protein [Candidatus Bathyarchaeota archaeon]
MPFKITQTAVILVVLFVAAFGVYWVTGEGHTWYDYYVRLADAFLHGRLYLLDNPSWLNELIPNPNGPGWYVVYPPLPAFLMTPFVAIWGLNLNQTLFGLFFAAATVSIAYMLSKSVLKKAQEAPPKNNYQSYVWFAVLFGFSTIFWYLSSIGSVWLIAQVIATFFMFLALYEAFNKNRPLLIGLLVGASFWCRLPTVLGIFFFVAMAISQQPIKGIAGKFTSALPYLLKLAIGTGIFVVFEFLYNYARFGTIFPVGYWMIPGVLDEPWFSHGHFSLLYIADNLTPFLTGLPILTSVAPYVQFPMSGIAIWITTPAFIFALKSKLKDPVTWSSWLAIFCIAAVIFTNAATGWGFGYRYAMDFYPFLFILTVRGMGSNLKWYHKLLIIIGIIVNCWGVIAINKFPDVSVLV